MKLSLKCCELWVEKSGTVDLWLFLLPSRVKKTSLYELGQSSGRYLTAQYLT